MTALRWVLGAVAGCAAPLVCRVTGHGPYQLVNDGNAVQCIGCGDWWPLRVPGAALEGAE